MELSPDVGHSKYMYLGQINTGQESVDFYTKGIQVLLSALEKQAQITVSKALYLLTFPQWLYIHTLHELSRNAITPKA